ncbi:MAG TPA: type II toxin-antitoxin system RelE/ParE family toxin [Hyphomicrobiales bacterium]|nr:type II toxin-antitoxin system RelE/ParE family toxin [Kaistiaceae bacterium]HQF31358.1 type II toxin-antitoxin system RelE/ParE family toxin [Hyphomicrobiales bacterium]
MLEIDLSKKAADFLGKLPPKHARQIAERLQALREDPDGVPSSELKGYAPLRRARAGEYRITFFVEDGVLRVPLVGKRNDDEIYRLIERFMR